MFFILLIFKNFFINSIKHFFFVFENKKCFPEFSSQTQFFFLLKTQKIVFKNCFLEQFSKTATKHTLRLYLESVFEK